MPHISLLGLMIAALPLAGMAADEDAVASARNDAADLTISRDILPEGFAGNLIVQLDSRNEGIIWRNYILQKLDSLYLHPDVPAKLEPAILDRLWQYSRNPTPTFSGTSLMTLLRLHEARPDVVPSDELASRCMWVVTRPAYSNSDRLSALHVLSSVDEPKALQIGRDWLGASDTAPMLQLTALAVLGKNPTRADLSLIEPYTSSPDLRLRTAAKAALAKSQRTQGADQQ